MQSLKIGHYTQFDQGTGITTFLFDRPAEVAYCLCGSAPATRDLHALELEAYVSHIDGLVFTGGSAYGLGAVKGVMQWFQEQGRGYPTPHGPVPVVPAAAIYDLGVKSSTPPTAEAAYQACVAATSVHQRGRLGAGTGATVGKLVGSASPMTGGVGYASLTLPDGLEVLAYAVVNCVGDVRDTNHNIIAGACHADGQFVDCDAFLLSGQRAVTDLTVNTTLVAVFTNAAFSKIELKRIAKVALAGMAQTISPVFTRYDGDLIFCVSLGEQVASEMTVGAMAREAVRQSILNAVTDSVIL